MVYYHFPIQNKNSNIATSFLAIQAFMHLLPSSES